MNHITKTVLLVCLFVVAIRLSAQTNTFPTTGSAGIGTTDPNPSALLEISSTTKGILVPRMTKSQRDAIVSPATGLLIYQTNLTPGFYFFDGTSWGAVAPKNSANKSLNNLTSPTAVGVTLQPNADNTVDLGAATFSWKDLYVDGIGYLGTAKVSNFSGTPQSGMIRFNGTDFQGYNGTSWVTLGGTGGGANTSLNNLTTTSINQSMIPDADGTRSIGSVSKGWDDLYVNDKAFIGNLIVGNVASGFQAGSIRYGLDGFEGYDGTEWKSFTELSGEIDSGLYATTDLTNLASTAVNVNLNPNFDNTRDIGQTDKAWNDIYFDGAVFSFDKELLKRTNDGDIYIGDTKNTYEQIGYNIFIGDSAGHAVDNQSGNIFIGKSAGRFSETSSATIAIGNSAGESNTGDGCIIIGGDAGSNNTSANNIFIGAFSGQFNTSGVGNSFLGTYSGKNITTGNYNTCIGQNSGRDLTTGNNNTTVGQSAGLYASGSDNTFLGYAAGLLSTAGGNTFIGTSSGANTSTGNGNVFLGFESGLGNETGWGNTYLGYSAGSMGDGYANTCVGRNAGKGGSDGSSKYNVYLGTDAALNNDDAYNVVIGSYAANTYSGMDNSVLIGYNNDVGSNNYTNAICIGSNASISQSNSIRIGNTSVTKLGIGKNTSSGSVMEFQTTTAKLTTGGVWTDASDKKLKRNIKQLDKQEILDKINQLSVTEWNYIADEQHIRHIGPMAQDFYSLFGLGDDTTIAAMDKAGVALIGIQALSSEIFNNSSNDEEQKREIETLQNENAELKHRLEKLEAAFFGDTEVEEEVATQTIKLFEGNTTARIEQNTPNPFSGKTYIRYFIPASGSKSEIKFINQAGIEVKTVSLAPGNGMLEIDATEISSGTYSYSLLVDGKVCATKHMILTK